MRGSLPKIAVRFLLVLFALSWLALLFWLVYFAFLPDVAPDQVGGVTEALLLTAILSGSSCLASGLLAHHFRREEYSAGEAVIFGSLQIVSAGIFVCSGVWALAAVVFG